MAVIDNDGLNVWHKDKLVGYLWRNSVNYMGFRYDQTWIHTHGFAISQTLPLDHDDYTPEVGLAHRFFANLLPEGGAREQIVRDYKVSNTEFSLLRAIGGECAGALSILPVEESPISSVRYQKISNTELANLIAKRGYGFINKNDNDRPRLSLAGAQNKCAVYLRNNEYYLPVGNAPSTHILKFESKDYRHLPAYEVFTMLLARNAGLPVADIDLMQDSNRFFARVTRYDRSISRNSNEDPPEITRLHQEDFCQAMGYGQDKKYQSDGGPSFAECVQLLRETSSDPALDVPALLKWLVFNVLAGNSDGHAKNLSLLHTPDAGIRLAPFYDLVCTRAIDRIDSRLAFEVGEQRIPEKINKYNWARLADQCDLGSRYLQSLVSELAELLPQSLETTLTQFKERYGPYPSLQRIEKIVTEQCRKA